MEHSYFITTPITLFALTKAIKELQYGDIHAIINDNVATHNEYAEIAMFTLEFRNENWILWVWIIISCSKLPQWRHNANFKEKIHRFWKKTKNTVCQWYRTIGDNVDDLMTIRTNYHYFGP